MEEERRDQLLQAIWDDGRYPPAAYAFVQEGFEYTNEVIGAAGQRESRHVSGQELCQGLRTLALRRWGLLAKTVLDHWNVHRTRDFGEIVYFLVRFDRMATQESDSINDFDDVYSFDDAFDSYLIPLDANGD